MTVPMPIPEQTGLDALRAEIDSLDRQMQELLIRRFEVTREVANLKQSQRSQNNWRPSRQAQLLRGLVERHRGTCPQTALIRIWQEIMGASLALQGPFSVGVAIADTGDLWDIARDHFGNVAPMGLIGPAPQVVGAVTEGDIAVGIVPLPNDGEEMPWWRLIGVGNDGETPVRVVARLPLFGAQGARGNAAIDGFALARLAIEPSGQDRCLMAVETSQEVSRGGIAALAGKMLPAGARVLASAVENDGRWWLIEADQFLPVESPSPFATEPQIRHYVHLGCYAAPHGA